MATNFNFNGGNGDYAVSVSFRRRLSNRSVVRVTSASELIVDVNVTALVQQFMQTRSLLQPDAGEAPPIMIDGCLNKTVGNPDIYPANSGPAAGTAIATSQSASCIEQGHFDLHGGSIDGNYFPSGTLWDQLFSISRSEMQAVANDEVAAGVAFSDRRVLWITSSSNWQDSVGTPAQPVILIFANGAGCPKINGGPTIYGIAFFDDSCGGGGHGWGGANVFGTVAYSSTVGKINANTEFFASEYAGGAETPAYPILAAYRFHGTWTDIPQ